VMSLTPYANYGSRALLNAERALVRFDDEELREVLAGRAMERAMLVLTLADSPETLTRDAVSVFALSQEWAEDGATWLCSDAFVNGGLSRRCPLGRSWSMSNDGSR